MSEGEITNTAVITANIPVGVKPAAVITESGNVAPISGVGSVNVNPDGTPVALMKKPSGLGAKMPARKGMAGPMMMGGPAKKGATMASNCAPANQLNAMVRDQISKGLNQIMSNLQNQVGGQEKPTSGSFSGNMGEGSMMGEPMMGEPMIMMEGTKKKASPMKLARPFSLPISMMPKQSGCIRSADIIKAFHPVITKIRDIVNISGKKADNNSQEGGRARRRTRRSRRHSKKKRTMKK